MKIKILGSAAAEGIPAIFCNCRVCREAAKSGGKEIRSRTAYALNDAVRVDFGPDSLWQEQRERLHAENLRHLFVTHSHEDHLYPQLLWYRCKGFSALEPDNLLNVYGNVGVIKALADSFASVAKTEEMLQLRSVLLKRFEPVELPDEDMTILPLAADHMPSEEPMFFAIRQGDKHALIANDTGDFPAESWAALSRYDAVFDIVILDCTFGLRTNGRGHMGGETIFEVCDRLRKLGRIDGQTQLTVNHFSHNGQGTHAELEAFFTPHGIRVGFDGMTLQA